MRKTIAAILAAIALSLSVAACASDADVASQNLSKAADNFQIYRQTVFYNGVTGDYIAEIDGFCSIGNHDDAGKVSITCKLQDGKFIKDYLGLSDNVTFFTLQSTGADVSTQHYKVVFKPSTVIPDIDVR